MAVSATVRALGAAAAAANCLKEDCAQLHLQEVISCTIIECFKQDKFAHLQSVLLCASTTWLPQAAHLQVASQNSLCFRALYNNECQSLH